MDKATARSLSTLPALHGNIYCKSRA